MSDRETTLLERTSDSDSKPCTEVLQNDSTETNCIQTIEIATDNNIDSITEAVVKDENTTPETPSPKTELIEEVEDTKTCKLSMDVQDSQSTDTKANLPESWPTLEILPGGVIKNAEDYPCMYQARPTDDLTNLMYACAKCPERFRFLNSLVKHVRCHREEQRARVGHDLSKFKVRKVQKAGSAPQQRDKQRKNRPRTKIPAKIMPNVRL